MSPARRPAPETIIFVPAPAPWMNANDRYGHWAVRKRLTRQWRTAAAYVTRAKRLPAYGDQQVRITAYIHKTTTRRFDVANLAPTVKAIVDGLRDADLLVDDDNKHLIGPDLRVGIKQPHPGVTLVINLTEQVTK